VKINLFIDIKIIIDNFFAKGTNRSGIYFVAWNILKIMQKNESFNITLAYPIERESSASLKKIKKHPFFSQFKFVCAGAESKMLMQQKVEKYKKNKNYIGMFYNYLRLTNLKRKEKFHYNKEYFKDAKIYLSPYNAIPQKILEQEHIKKIYILHDIVPIVLPEPEYSGEIAFNAMLNTLNRNIYYFCVSQSCKDDFLKYCGDKLDSEKMFVTHNATNQDYVPNYNKQELMQILKKYNVEHSPSDKYLFSLCTLEPRKNLPFTISCFLKFIKKHNIQDLHFYLGGGIRKRFKSVKSVMAKILEEAGEFKHKIKLLGYIKDSDLNILYSNSLFFTFLSQYEGFGMPPLEAMQAGTPVITSNNSSLPEVVGDAAISLTYNDEPAVIKAYEDFYFNEDLRKDYIARGLERAKMFSWEKCVRQMMEVMGNL
jgi:glycosyltransferase involved in cell wall biosynthesis